MVEIPVEKKRSGIPWWVWLLVALGVLALIWFLMTRDGREGERIAPVATTEAAPADPMVADSTAGPAAGTAGAITNVAELTGDAAGLIGRRVSLMGVEVVSADETGGLFIGSSPTDRVFVSTSIPSGFAAGSRVNIEGTVQGGDSATAGRTRPPAGLPAGATHYIEADSIQPA